MQSTETRRKLLLDDIEARMEAFLRVKGAVANPDLLQRVEAAREAIREERTTRIMERETDAA